MEQLHPQEDPVEQAMQERMAEMQAYAMKPEMDRIAEERAAAPRAENQYILGEGGKLHEVSGQPDLAPEQQQEHAARRFYAEKDAQHVAELDATVLDRKQEIGKRIAARQLLNNLTSPVREARPDDQIKRVAH
jgi:hypothetical protein